MYGRNRYSNNVGRRYSRPNNAIVKKETSRSRANQIGKWLKAGSTMATIAKTVATTAKIAGLINIEFKQQYGNIGASANTTGTLALLNGMQLGTDVDDRVGRSIRIKSVQLNLINTQNASASNSIVRYLLVIDKQPSGATPNFSDILATAGNLWSSMRNLNNRKRFVILKDQFITMNSGTNNEIGVFEYYKKLDMHTIYNNTSTGTITDIESNALYLCLISNEPTNSVAVTGCYRVRYLDD